MSRIVHASSIGADECHIPIVAFAGESDNIVTPASARSVFPDTGVLPGDHFTIIRPDSLNHRAYTALKKNLLMLPRGRRGEPAPETTTADPSTGRTGTPPRRENSFTHVATDLAAYDSPDRTSVPVPGPGADEMSRVIARWNPRERTLDFIMSPEIALAWVKKLGEDESTNG
jgi:hypothetical protein